MYLERIQQLTNRLQQKNIDQQIISDPHSIYYYTGYLNDPGERLYFLLAQADGDWTLVLNRLFPPYGNEAALPLTTISYQDGEAIIDRISQRLKERIGIDKVWPAHFLLDLMQLRPDITYLNNSYIVDDQRAIKSTEEIEIMTVSSQKNDQAMLKLIDKLTHGKSEAAMFEDLTRIYRDLGIQEMSFEGIIAYGPNGADPHHSCDDSLPQVGDAVVIDIGGIWQGYASDMTRTVFYGEPSEEALEVYRLVQAANQAGIEAVRPDVPLSSIDLAARKVIEDGGYGEFFTHRLGHFIGQQAHEAGDVSQYNDAPAQVGQVFSIEPGIYLPGKFGVRIEDLVVVTETGCQVLNSVTKEPIILDLKP